MATTGTLLVSMNGAPDVSMEIKRENDKVIIGYRDVWFIHDGPDMLDTVADDIVNRATYFKEEDEEEQELVIVLYLPLRSVACSSEQSLQEETNTEILRTVIDENSLDLGEALLRFTNFFANLM